MYATTFLLSYHRFNPITILCKFGCRKLPTLKQLSMHCFMQSMVLSSLFSTQIEYTIPEIDPAKVWTFAPHLLHMTCLTLLIIFQIPSFIPSQCNLSSSKTSLKSPGNSHFPNDTKISLVNILKLLSNSFQTESFSKFSLLKICHTFMYSL